MQRMFNFETFNLDSYWQQIQNHIKDHHWVEAASKVVFLQSLLAHQFKHIEKALLSEANTHPQLDTGRSIFADIKELAQPANLYQCYLRNMRSFTQDALKKSFSMQSIQMHISHEARHLLNSMLKEIIKVYELGSPPSYAIVLMGSASRAEMTPYSDLEFAILIEDTPDQDKKTKNKNYFRLLMELLRLSFIRLGETPMINLSHNKVYTINGFSLDTTKSPLTTNINEGLILTPYELAQFHKLDDHHFIHEANCHLSSALLTSAYLACDDEVSDLAGKALWIAYQDEVQKIITSSDDFRRRKVIRILENDIISIEATLNAWASQIPDIKKLAYKPMTAIFDLIAHYHGLSETNAWQRLEKLAPLLDAETKQLLEQAWNKIASLRLKYSLLNDTADILNLTPSQCDMDDFAFLFTMMNEIYYSVLSFINGRNHMQKNRFDNLFLPSRFDETFASNASSAPKLVETVKATTATGINNIKTLCQPFIHRDALDKLKGLVNSAHKTHVDQFLLTGISGSGKSELAKRFSLDYAASQKSPLVWQFDAHSDESMWESYLSLARELMSDHNPHHTKTIQPIDMQNRNMVISFVNLRLLDFPEWLFLFDDASSAENVRDYIPNLNRAQVIVIITSQNEIIDNVRHIINLSAGFTSTEAHSLLSTITKLNDSQGAELLASRLDYLPLPLAVAARHIAYQNNRYQNRLTYLNYLNIYFPDNNTSLAAYNANIRQFTCHLGFIKVDQATAIQAAIKNLSMSFKKLLYFCAMINASEITPDLLENYINRTGLNVANEPTITQAPQILAVLTESDECRSLLNIHHGAQSKQQATSFYIHKTTQDQVRLYFHNLYKKAKTQQEEISAHEAMLATLNDEMTHGIVTEFDYCNKTSLLSHLKCLLEHVSPDLAASIPLAIAYQNLGRLYKAKGEAKLALDYYQKSLAIYLQQQTNVSGELLNLYDDMCRASQALAQFKQAKRYCEQALLILYTNTATKEQLAKFHNNYGRAYYDLAKDSLNQRQTMTINHVYNQLAILHLQMSVNYAIQAHGTNHPNVVYYLNGLSDVYRSVGNLKKANETINKALTIAKTVFPTGAHRILALVNYNLGRILQKQGDHRSALVYLETAIKIDKEIYGDVHPLIARHTDAMGKSLQKIGDLTKARSCFETSSLILARTHDTSHPLRIKAKKHLQRAIDVLHASHPKPQPT